MYTLQYTKGDPKVSEIKERLKQLSLAFKTEESPEQKEINFKDGNLQLSGTANILAYLDQISGELHHWYYCGC